MIRSRAGSRALADVRTTGGHMGFLGHSPTRRAIGLACALAWYIPVADLAAGTLEQADSPGAPQLSQPSAEPFGLSVSRVFAGPLREKWRKVERKLDDER